MTEFSNTILTVQNTLVTLLGSFVEPNGGTNPTVGRTQSSCGIASGDVPSIWVRRGTMTNRDEFASDRFDDTRTFYIWCYVEALCGNEQIDDSAYDNATNWIKPMHKYLAQIRNDLGEGTQIDVLTVRDSGDLTLSTKNSKSYAGIIFTVPVRFMTAF